MAVCGLLSMLCVFPIQPDMDSCPGRSFGVARNHLLFWETVTEAQASSCLSSTMVDSQDPDDSGSSQPLSTSESKHLNIREPYSQRPELELSISSLNDAQRNVQSGSGIQRLRPVKEEFDVPSASTGRDEPYGGPGGGEEEISFTGPPRKRAKMSSSPLGFRLEEGQAGNIREQVQRHSSLSSISDTTGINALIHSRSLPSFRATERESSPSQIRGSASGSKPPGASWWLMPKSSASVTEAQHFQSAQDAARVNFGIDGRGMILGSSLQERDYLFKEPSFFPNMLSSIDGDHGRRGEDVSPAMGARLALTEQGRPYSHQDPPEHSFLNRKEGSTSRVSSVSTISDETAPRSGLTFFSKNREVNLQETNPVYVQPTQHPSEGQGRGRNPSAPESQQRVYEREHLPGAVVRQGGADQRSLLVPPTGNANTTFYARIVDAAQQPVTSPFSQAGFASSFNPANISYNLPGHSISRGSSQPGVGSVHFGGEGSSQGLVQQQVNSEIMRNLLAVHPNITSLAPFMSQQVPAPDPARLSFPNISSLDFFQSLQRQPFPQVSDRYRPVAGQVVVGGPSQQDFGYLSTPQSLSAELNLSLPPRATQTGVQTSAGLREFLPPQGQFSPSQGRGAPVGPQGFTSTSAVGELPTNLSLRGPQAPTPLTVVMEGRSVDRRISLQEFDNYDSFAAAMRAMFDSHVSSQESRGHGESCSLANAISGYVIAYEDDEGDVLLAGDLPWRDFVRAAKQIRIVSSSKISFRPPNGPSR